jgi:V/A-type H+-transporting ATPase subunit E
MAGVEKIIEKIVQDSGVRAEEIINGAKAQATDIIKRANISAANKVEELKKKAENEINDKNRIFNSMAELEVRNELLNTKQEVIAKVFKGALDQLSSMDFKQYMELLNNMIVRAVETGEEEIVLSQKDKDRIPKSFIDEVNNILQQNGKIGALKLSNDTINISGGFLLKSSGVEINNSFEALIRMHRDEIEPKVAELLF